MEIMDYKDIKKLGELVLDKAINKFSEYQEKKQWEQIFVDANEFLLKKVEKGDLLLKDISEYLTSDELKQVASRLTQENKYELFDKIHVELEKLMIKYEIPKSEAQYYISSFSSIIFNELERVSPDAFQSAYLGDWRTREERTLEEVTKTLSDISNAICNLKKKEVSVYTPEQMEVALYKDTINPSLDLDFFEVDDEVFKEDFEESLAEENVYVKGQCKEETIFCVLNELRKIRPNKIVLIVKNEDYWKKLRIANEENKEIGGKILIPWFYSEQIFSIPNNTNIFVFGSEEHIVGKPVIEMRKRKRGTVRKNLEKLGMDYESAFRLVEDTHGLYIPMKKKLINGIDVMSPNWLKGDLNIILPLLLCGKWTETDGDIMVLEELCGVEYKKILQSIQNYFKGENPLFVRFKNHGTTFIHLASTENAWGYFDDLISFDSDLWGKYVMLISYIVTEENPIYNFPKEKRTYAHILPGGKACWSNALKEGLLRSLVMKAYYNNKPQNQNEIDKIVFGILEKVSTKNMWLSIARLFPIFCEASPCAVKKRLDNEWENETGLKNVFIEVGDGSFFARNEYTNIIWGIEQFLCQKDHAAWSVRWFLKMNEVNKKYPISNSPFATLETVFCAWFNVTALEQNEKILLAKEAFSKEYDVWGLFYSELPGVKNSIISSISKPKYRMVSEIPELTGVDVNNAFIAYLDLCINHMEFKVSRWLKLIERINHFGGDLVKKIADKLLYEIQSMDDIEKTTIKEKIREEIYSNRYYSSSEWAMQEKNIKLLEDLMQKIKVENEIYEYRYLFKNRYNFPLMNPVPFSEDEKREINEELSQKEIQLGIKRFKEKRLNVIKLAEICSEYDYSTLGMYMFTEYSEGQFDEGLFGEMIANKKIKNIMLNYIQVAYECSKDNLQRAYDIAKNNEVSKETLVQILSIEKIDGDNNPLIMNEDEDVKNLYWKSFGGGNIANTRTAHLIIDEMMKYSNHMSILAMLERNIDYFSEKEIFDILEKIKNHELGEVTQLTEYQVEKLLSKIQNYFINTEECLRVAIVEIMYRGIISVAKMRCLNKCLRESPDLYLGMLAIIYKTDDGKQVDGIVELDDSNINNIYMLYHDLKFCPGEENGEIDSERLKTWILEFENGLKHNKQMRLFDIILGKLFAFSPKGKDGLYPTEEVRAIIETMNSKSLENEYVTTIFNSRGVYSPTGGAEERKIALDYKETADKMRVSYPITAEIYEHLSARYFYEADSERESDEYAGI